MSATPVLPLRRRSGSGRDRPPSDLFAALRECGVAIWDGPLDVDVARALRDEVKALQGAGCFRPAHVGRGHRQRRIPEVRGDSVLWLLPPDDDAHSILTRSANLRAFLEVLTWLRAGLRRLSFSTLNKLELHASHYPPGTHYALHIDRFVGTTERQFTFVYFLNDGWEPADGGALQIHRPVRLQIEPVLGRLVIFHTPEVLHEVARTERDRFALTGWLGCARAL